MSVCAPNYSMVHILCGQNLYRKQAVLSIEQDKYQDPNNKVQKTMLEKIGLRIINADDAKQFRGNRKA